MSCSPECVEFMDKCYEELKGVNQVKEEYNNIKEEEKMLVDPEEMEMSLNMLADVLRIEEATVKDAKQHRMFFQSIVQDLFRNKPFVLTLKTVMNLDTEEAREKLLDELKYMFTEDEVMNASVLLSDPFPIDGGYTECLRRWLSQERNIKDFLMATKVDRALNLITETLRLLCLIPRLNKEKKEKNHNLCEKIFSKIEQLLEASRINILPLLINSQLIEMFNPDTTRIQRNEMYKEVKESFEGYHLVLESLEDKCSEGEYLRISKTLMKSFKDQRTFTSMFEDDCLGNIVSWECSGMEFDFITQIWSIYVEQ